MKIILICVFHYICVSAADRSTIISPLPSALSYEVIYAGMKIAEIDFSESSPYEYEGNLVRELECRIESSGFINVNGLYRSIVTDDYSVLYFRSDEGRPGNNTIRQHWFDYEGKTAKIQDDRINGDDTVSTTWEVKDIDRRYLDSQSLIFRLRDGLDTMNTPTYIPIFVHSRPDSILIESISTDRVEGPEGEPVDANVIRGRILFPTFPGFGNKFEIYISNDERRIPLYAKLEMALGFAEIRLRRDR